MNERNIFEQQGLRTVVNYSYNHDINQCFIIAIIILHHHQQQHERL